MPSLNIHRLAYKNTFLIPEWSDCFCKFEGQHMYLKTKNGTSTLKFPCRAKVQNKTIVLSSQNTGPMSLLKNLIKSHHKKYFVILRLKGSNYRFQISEVLNLEVGKSHKTVFNIPRQMTVQRYLESKDSFFIKGVNPISVNNFVFKLRNTKPVNPYTGSGLLFNKERLKLKQGKKK